MGGGEKGGEVQHRGVEGRSLGGRVSMAIWSVFDRHFCLMGDRQMDKQMDRWTNR